MTDMTLDTKLPALPPTMRWALRALVLVLVFESAGCAWFRHRRDGRNADAEIAAVVAKEAARRTAPAEAVPAADTTTASPPATPAGLTDAELAAARKLADDFYEMHARFAGRGLPDPTAMNAYNAFLCPSLSAALATARGKQAAFIAAHPGDKPPLVEGDLFTSLFEGEDSAQALDAVADGDGARVTVALGHGVGPGATRWRDTLILGRDQGIWCVADVAYGGAWPFANTGRLADSLQSAF